MLFYTPLYIVFEESNMGCPLTFQKGKYFSERGKKNKKKLVLNVEKTTCILYKLWNLRVYLDIVYFIEIEKLLLKVL